MIGVAPIVIEMQVIHHHVVGPGVGTVVAAVAIVKVTVIVLQPETAPGVLLAPAP
jgi:hypothetical protein